MTTAVSYNPALCAGSGGRNAFYRTDDASGDETIGGENKALGFGIAALSVLAFLMLAFCFFTTKERVEAPATHTSMREDLRDIWHNDGGA
ncbi:hypothetical protein KCP74_06060 [Salmonella enterica subsp. enterica]|nr:hypothetical protein KCP74_06060 [Salmonella enterica subsp. enterica]